MRKRNALSFVPAGIFIAAVCLVGVVLATHTAHFSRQWERTVSTVQKRDEIVHPSPALPTSSRPGSQFYVAAAGTPDQKGSKEHPWDLATALSQPNIVKPGDTIWLRGGTYKGAFTSTLSGRENQPILIRQCPGERATIDGSLTVQGAWATYWGFEVMNSNPDRSKERPTGVEIYGPHTKFINLIVHDAGNGFAFWTPAVDAELYGNIIYHNGWEAYLLDRGHGHAIYTQNDEGTKLIRDNIIFNQFGWGIHAYTEGGQINGFHFEGNVSFNNGSLTRQGDRYSNILVGGYKPAERISLINNYTYHPLTKSETKPNVSLHYTATNNKDLTVKDNYFAGGSLVVSVREWEKVTMTGNTFLGVGSLLELGLPQGVAAAAYEWSNNTYSQGGASMPLIFQGQTLDFAGWQKTTGLDKNSRWMASKSGRPGGVKIFIRPNQYERGRATIVVYNWDLNNTVNVDVRSVLAPGAKYEIRNVQNYFGAPVLGGVYDGKPLRLPMTGLKGAEPIGYHSGAEPTGPEFNVFVLLQVP